MRRSTKSAICSDSLLSSSSWKSKLLRQEKVDLLIKNAKKGIFTEKNFLIDNKRKEYTHYYQFFMSKTEISKFDKISKLMDFFCIICTRKFSYKLGEISNLEKHLRCHEASREYIQL